MKKIEYRTIKISEKLKKQSNLSTNQLKSLIYQNLKEIQRKKEIAKKEKLRNKFDSPFLKNKKGEYVLKKAYTPDDKFVSSRLFERYEKIKRNKRKKIFSFDVKTDFEKGSKIFFKMLNEKYKINELNQGELVKIYNEFKQNNQYFINYIFGQYDAAKYKDYTNAISSAKQIIEANKQIIESTFKKVLSEEKFTKIIKK